MLTDRQLDMMNVLWEKGSATVREAKDELEEDLAYTSVLTVYQTLRQNGYVEARREGRADRYTPLVSRREAAVEYRDFLEENGLLNELWRLREGAPPAAVDREGAVA